MELKLLSAKEYGEIFQQPYHVFNRADFNAFNAEYRNIDVEYLAFKSKKYKLGLIAGKINNKLASPFSAPFGGFSYVKNDVSLETIDESVDLLINYGKNNGFKNVELTLPPSFYEESFISKLNNSFYRKHFSLSKSDLNYSIPVQNKMEDYAETLHYNAKKNLTIALSKGFEFKVCKDDADRFAAYEIIRQNRESKGFPLKMSFENVSATIKLIKADFFTVALKDENVAAAMVFHVSEEVAQVVYWGDLIEYAANKTMNFLSYSIVQHYSGSSLKYVDIGPSTENSIPNYGLCDFKESIGCNIHSKSTWVYEY